MTWTHEAVRNIRDEQICEMFDDGMKQVDIAKKVGLTKGRINQILQRRKKDEIEVVKFSPKRGEGKV